jgi:methionine-rich copper-binding protein CopC
MKRCRAVGSARSYGLGRVIVACVLACALIPAAAASADTFTVTGTSDSTAPCGGTVCPSLRSAIAAANAHGGSTVQLGAGTFTLGKGNGAPVDTGELQVHETMTIAGAGMGRTIIKQTDGQDRVLDSWYSLATITLRNLTLTGGSLGAGTSQAGAGIYTTSPLVLDHVSVSGNVDRASDALAPTDCCQSVGGIVSLSSLTLIDSSVSNNRAVGSPGANSTTAAPGGAGGQAVGGILATQGSPLKITDSSISGNVAASGSGGTSTLGVGGPGGFAYGGLYVIDTAPLQMAGSRFSGNIAQAGSGGRGLAGGPGGSSYGGALFSPDGALGISSSTFDHNLAAAGNGGVGTAGPGGAGGEVRGGAVAGGSRLLGNNVIANSTFYANEARGAAGGSGAPAGADGMALGGGVSEDTDSGLTLESSTLDSNTATGPGATYGGNLFDQFRPIALADDIFSHGVAANGNNCVISAAETDDGHNLESSTGECGLSIARGDLIGADPQLEPLAANGGPTPTMALAVGSPAIHAGGTCRDYSVLGNPALSVDQRGRPRPVPCDIGAFERQPDDATTPPGGGGQPSSGTPPRLSHVRESAKRWREGRALARLASRHRAIPAGTTFTFNLNVAARIELSFVRVRGGHRRNVAAGKLTLAHGHAGKDRIHFGGRISRKRRLKPGTYLVTIRAIAAAGHAASRPLRFTIVG